MTRVGHLGSVRPVSTACTPSVRREGHAAFGPASQGSLHSGRGRGACSSGRVDERLLQLERARKWGVQAPLVAARHRGRRVAPRQLQLRDGRRRAFDRSARAAAMPGCTGPGSTSSQPAGAGKARPPGGTSNGAAYRAGSGTLPYVPAATAAGGEPHPRIAAIDAAIRRIRRHGGGVAPPAPLAGSRDADQEATWRTNGALAGGIVVNGTPGSGPLGGVRPARKQAAPVDAATASLLPLAPPPEAPSTPFVGGGLPATAASRMAGNVPARSRGSFARVVAERVALPLRRRLPGPGAATDEVQMLRTDETFKWARDSYDRRQRTVDTWTFVITLRARLYLVDAKWTYLRGFTEDKQKQRRRQLAAWVRESILQLGPTFIKLGQLSSTRSDLLPKEFVEELSKLQDRVPAFSAEKAEAFIERELGKPVDELFAEFERQPIAAASLGQVHRAVLWDGEAVVVKVQRPGLKELFDIDLGNMKTIAEYFQKSEAFGGPSRDWLGIYEECSTILYQEIDYINEGRNADRFATDFRRYEWVKVPAVFWDYTTRKVLTLEYCPGIKINDLAQLDAQGISRSVVASRAIEAYLIQILRTGFFHADPHPGNLAVAAASDGTLIYYDFGMMGEIKLFTKEKLLEMFYAVYEKDAKKVIAALIDLGALQPTGDLSSVRRSVQFFLENLTGPQVKREATISAIGEDLFAIATDQPFRFPSTFTFVLRAFSTLEGVGKTLDPEFSFAKIAAPYAQELLDVRDGKQPQEFMLQQLQKQAVEVSNAAVAMPARVARMDDIIRQLDTGELKIRVRVLEAERAARRAGVMQTATINTVAVGTLINIGVTLTTQGATGPASVCFVLAVVFSIFVIFGFKRVKKLDQFEKML